MERTAPGTQNAGLPVRDVQFDAPWEWLAAGWRDLWRVWPISLGYGAIFAIAAFLLLAGLFQQGSQATIIALAAGFLILGPLLAVGLYEASRRIAANEPISLGSIALVKTKSPMQLAYLGVLLMLLFMFWVRFAMLLFALFFGHANIPPISEFLPMLMTSVNGVSMLLVGSVFGGILAVTAFALSAISVPLLMDRQIDFFTAVATSIKALFQNPRAMLLWGAIIAGLTLVGMATFFVGLIVVFPLLGHATWHAYISMVEVEAAEPVSMAAADDEDETPVIP